MATDDLFAKIDGDEIKASAKEAAPAAKGASPFDLLGGMGEGNEVQSWIPENAGDGIQGRVTHVGTIASDYSDEMLPYIELVDAEGEEWGIRGYGSVLARELSKANLAVGDTLAVKYFGLKKVEKGRWAGKDYKHYRVASVKPVNENGGATPF